MPKDLVEKTVVVQVLPGQVIEEKMAIDHPGYLVKHVSYLRSDPRTSGALAFSYQVTLCRALDETF